MATVSSVYLNLSVNMSTSQLVTVYRCLMTWFAVRIFSGSNPDSFSAVCLVLLRVFFLTPFWFESELLKRECL